MAPHRIRLSSWALIAVCIIIGGDGVRGFAPATRPHETLASQNCVICAFVMNEYQRELALELVALTQKLGGPAATRRQSRFASDPSALMTVALALNESLTNMITDGWAYNVDENHVRIAPPGAANASSAEDDFENELPTLIKARRDRRAFAGLNPGASPWVMSALPGFFQTYLDGPLQHYISYVPPKVAATTPSPNASGVSLHEYKRATQPQHDGPHEGDFVRFVAAVLDVMADDGLAPPAHFMARFGCIVELHVCPESSDHDEAYDAPDVEEDIIAETGESAGVYYRGLHARGDPSLATQANAATLSVATDSAFTDALLSKLDAAERHSDDGATAHPTPAQLADRGHGLGATVLHPEDEAALLGIDLAEYVAAQDAPAEPGDAAADSSTDL